MSYLLRTMKEDIRSPQICKKTPKKKFVSMELNKKYDVLVTPKTNFESSKFRYNYNKFVVWKYCTWRINLQTYRYIMFIEFHGNKCFFLCLLANKNSFRQKTFDLRGLLLLVFFNEKS